MCRLPRSGVAGDELRRTARRAKGALHRLVVAADAGGTRSHGSAPKPDPLRADPSNAEIESLAAHLASLR